MAAAANRTALVNRCHHDPVRRDADDKKSVVVGAATIEVDAAMPGRHESFGGIVA